MIISRTELKGVKTSQIELDKVRVVIIEMDCICFVVFSNIFIEILAEYV